jgi:hypothetical protein
MADPFLLLFHKRAIQKLTLQAQAPPGGGILFTSQLSRTHPWVGAHEELGIKPTLVKQSSIFCFSYLPNKPLIFDLPRIDHAQTSAKQNNAFCFFFWKKKNYLLL